MNESFSRAVGEFLLSQEARRERRKFIRDILIGLACLVALFAAAAVPTNALAQDIPVHVLEKDGVQIRLMNKPCVDAKTLAQINPAQAHRFKAIESVWPERDGSKKKYAGCWVRLTKEEARHHEDVFLLVFEDNTSGGVPASEFRKTKGTVGI